MRAFPVNAAGHPLRLDASLDERDRPVVSVAGAEYHTVDDLVGDFADADSGERLALFCAAWLRLNHGSGYRLIHDPAEFRNRYHIVKPRGYAGARGRQSAPGLGAYDVAEISEPQLYNDTLRCYVEDRHNGIPYRVEMPWPMNADRLVQFQLLPLEGEEDCI